MLAAAALAALGAAAHHHASHSHFTLQELRILAEPVESTDGQVVVRLPDLGVLRGGPPVVRGEVDTSSSDDADVDIRLDGFRQAEASAAGGSAGFTFVLRGGSADAVTGGGEHQIDVVGRPGAWRLTSLVAANARAALGGGAMAALVPREVTPGPPPMPVVVTMLLALTLAAAAWGVTFPEKRIVRAHRWLAASAAAIMLAAVALPYATRWRHGADVRAWMR